MSWKQFLLKKKTKTTKLDRLKKLTQKKHKNTNIGHKNLMGEATPSKSGKLLLTMIVQQSIVFKYSTKV